MYVYTYTCRKSDEHQQFCLFTSVVYSIVYTLYTTHSIDYPQYMANSLDFTQYMSISTSAYVPSLQKDQTTRYSIIMSFCEVFLLTRAVLCTATKGRLGCIYGLLCRYKELIVAHCTVDSVDTMSN